MNPFQRRLHCLVKREPEGYWAAYCLDFTLYAVGDTQEEAKARLIEQVIDYIRDAVVGDEVAHGGRLLTRRAPIGDWVGFYARLGWQHLSHLSESIAFRPIVPLAPPCRQA